MLLRLGVYAMVLSMLLPLFVAVRSSGKRREAEEQQKVEAVQNALQLEERRRQYGDELLEKARAGDAQAQYAYAWFLYRGGRGEAHRSEALSWVQQAADSGLPSARRLLESAYWEEQLSPEEIQDAEPQGPAMPVDESISLPVVGSAREAEAADAEGAEPAGTPAPSESPKSPESPASPQPSESTPPSEAGSGAQPSAAAAADAVTAAPARALPEAKENAVPVAEEKFAETSVGEPAEQPSASGGDGVTPDAAP